MFLFITQSLTNRCIIWRSIFSISFPGSLNKRFTILSLENCWNFLPRSSNCRESEQGGRGEARGYYEGPHVELPGKISRHKCSPDSQLVSLLVLLLLLLGCACLPIANRAKAGAGFGRGRILGAADRMGAACRPPTPHWTLSLLGRRG